MIEKNFPSCGFVAIGAKSKLVGAACIFFICPLVCWKGRGGQGLVRPGGGGGGFGDVWFGSGLGWMFWDAFDIIIFHHAVMLLIFKKNPIICFLAAS